MIINTKEISTRVKYGSMIFTIIVSLIIVAIFLLRLKNPNNIVIPLIGIFILYFVFLSIKNYNYIYYNSNGLKIIIRYISLSPFAAGNYSIEFSRQEFVKGEIKTKYAGLRTELTIFVQTNQGVAKFKPVSLSTLSKKEQEALIQDIETIKN